MFFSSSYDLLKILIVGVFSYIGLVVMLRISGNRTLSQMNSFDFIITIAMGSTLSSGMIQKNVTLIETVFALGILISLQYLATKASVKSKTINRILKNDPVVLCQDGHLLEDAMKEARVVEVEISAAMRASGVKTFSEVESVVLENNGKLSVIPK